jgi:hypothetical protein
MHHGTDVRHDAGLTGIDDFDRDEDDAQPLCD